VEIFLVAVEAVEAELAGRGVVLAVAAAVVVAVAERVKLILAAAAAVAVLILALQEDVVLAHLLVVAVVAVDLIWVLEVQEEIGAHLEVMAVEEELAELCQHQVALVDQVALLHQEALRLLHG
jgi:hypothetical protein